MIYGYIHFLGDSLTNGARDPIGRCFPVDACLWLSVVTKQSWLPLIDAENGITSSMLASRAPRFLLDSPAKEVVILIGTNDARDNIPPAIYKDNIDLLVASARVSNKRPYLCTIPIPKGFGSSGYTRSIIPKIEYYNNLIYSLREEVIDLAKLIDIEEYFIDGIHFSREGNVKVGKAVADYILSIRTFGESNE
jgi:lysophospholipase L1-like esterase